MAALTETPRVYIRKVADLLLQQQQRFCSQLEVFHELVLDHERLTCTDPLTGKELPDPAGIPVVDPTPSHPDVSSVDLAARKKKASTYALDAVRHEYDTCTRAVFSPPSPTTHPSELI